MLLNNHLYSLINTNEYAMKMEIELLSPVSGRVVDVRREAGQAVSPGTPVVIVEETNE